MNAPSVTPTATYFALRGIERPDSRLCLCRGRTDHLCLYDTPEEARCAALALGLVEFLEAEALAPADTGYEGYYYRGGYAVKGN